MSGGRVLKAIFDQYVAISRTVADPGFAKEGADHGERAEREPKRGSGGGPAEPPAGSRGRAPGGGQGGEAPLKLKAFCTFLHKIVAKS